jgi:hypothetical protein
MPNNTMQTLANLQQIDPREAWRIEPDFTRWLAEEENLAALGEELGLDLSPIQAEANVGDFKVDILAEETGSGVKVIIENQLETTDHDHLGKLVTYASGHDAGYIVWVFRDMREEHRQAIDWLNEHTTEDVNFFAVKLELWQIGDSLPAPKFDVVSRPNEWAKIVKRQSSQAQFSEGKLKQQNFWEQLRAFAKEKQVGIRPQAARPQHWLSISIGTSRAHVSLTVNTQKGQVGCELVIPNDHELYEHLHEQKDAIEQELGVKLDWHDRATVGRYINEKHSPFDIDDEDSYPKHFEWLLARAIAFKKAFAGRIKNYQQNV